MILREEQYERIARYLDGEPIELTTVEREAVTDLHLCDRELPPLEVPVPPGAMERARRRLVAAAARPHAGRTRWWAWTGGAIAAAAVVALAVGAWIAWQPKPQTPAPPATAVTAPANVFVAAMEDSDAQSEIAAVQVYVEDMDDDVIVDRAAPTVEPVDVEIESLEDEIENLLLETGPILPTES